MATVKSVNIDRILWCCKDRRIATSELASAIQIAPDKMDSILAGELNVTFVQLRKIAKFFNRGLLFFLEHGDVREDRIRTSGFRTLANDNPELDMKVKAIIERVERQREVFIALKEDLDEKFVDKFNPPDLQGKNAENAASVVREWTGITRDFSFDTYRKALENKGVLVFRSMAITAHGKFQKKVQFLVSPFITKLIPSFLFESKRVSQDSYSL